jgi:hypothetical protein
MKTKYIFIILIMMTIQTVNSQEIPYWLYYNDTTFLIVMPYNSADSLEWGPYGIDITAGNGASNIYYGLPNTEAIVDQLGDNGGVLYPAKICDTLTAFGYEDWYLPSLWELGFLSIRQDSIGNPIGCFWGSWEYDSVYAYRMIMSNGYYEGSTDIKSYQYSCRCVRREHITNSSNTENLIKEVKIIPDLTNKEVNIRIKGIAGEYELSIYNIQGNRMENRKIKVAGDGYSGRIDISDFAKGTYIVEVRNGKFVKTGKFVL